MKISDGGMSSVRGIAALIVVIAHSIQIFIIRLIGVDHVIAKSAGLMAVWAVFVFFIISGFLITSSVIKNTKANNGNFNLVNFASARISRIYPPLIFAAIISITIYYLLIIFKLPGSVVAAPYGLPNDFYAARRYFSINLIDITNALLMKNGFLEVNGPLWSLCVEWRIYIVVGCLAMLLTSKSLICGVIWGSLFIFSLISLKAVDSNAYFYFLVWLTGGCVAILGGGFKFLKPFRVFWKLLWIVALLVVLAIFLLTQHFFLQAGL